MSNCGGRRRGGGCVLDFPCYWSILNGQGRPGRWHAHLLEGELVIPKKFLLMHLVCGLIVAACTPTTRPSQPTQPATAASATATATAAETVAAAEAQPSDSSQEVVCRNETVTGSRFQRRYCATKAEREQRQKEDRESGETLQRKGAYANPRPEG
jgi:hypothetical protein